MQTQDRLATPVLSPLQPRRNRPVLWWATAGGVFIVIQVAIYGSWLLSGNAKRTPNGPDPVWGWTKVVIHGYEVLACTVALAVLYFVVIRPWRRNGEVTWDGMLCGAFLSIYWQDVLFNYSGAAGTYNTEFFNLGSWLGNIPGVVQPNAERFAEPLLFSPQFYFAGFFLFVAMSCAVIRWAKRRWAHISNGTLTVLIAAFFVILDVVLEVVLLGMLNVEWYPGAPSALTLFHGRRWQLPYHEILLVSTIFTIWTLLRHHRDDKGRSIAERGIERVPGSGRKQNTLRFLALVGIINVTYLVAYMLPWNLMGPRQSPWPDVFLEHSWMRDGLCGEGTDYACPGPGIPNPRPDSVHLAPDGRLVAP